MHVLDVLISFIEHKLLVVTVVIDIKIRKILFLKVYCTLFINIAH